MVKTFSLTYEHNLSLNVTLDNKGKVTPYAFVEFHNVDDIAKNEALRAYSAPKIHLSIGHDSL
jgi:hypothetical protein